VRKGKQGVRLFFVKGTAKMQAVKNNAKKLFFQLILAYDNN
jgi:hypothetical protein